MKKGFALIEVLSAILIMTVFLVPYFNIKQNIINAQKRIKTETVQLSSLERNVYKAITSGLSQILNDPAFICSKQSDESYTIRIRDNRLLPGLVISRKN